MFLLRPVFLNKVILVGPTAKHLMFRQKKKKTDETFKLGVLLFPKEADTSVGTKLSLSVVGKAWTHWVWVWLWRVA